jgi:hypothetical protein
MNCNAPPVCETLICSFEKNVPPRHSAGFIPKKSYIENSKHELQKMSSTDLKDQATVTEREIA